MPVLKFHTRAENNLLRFIAIAAITVAAGGLLAYFYMHPPFSKHYEATCQGNAENISFTIHPSFYLNKKFLPSTPISEADLATYAERHLRFIHTSIPAFKSADSPKFAAIPYDGYKISRIEQVTAKYPLALNIYNKGIHERVTANMKKLNDLDSKYILQALSVGGTSTDDDAVKVTYEAQVRMLLCENENHRFRDQIILPTDPFLAFWFVPETERIVKFNEPLKTNDRITPCATEDLLYDHDPYYYWYYWSLDSEKCQPALTKNSLQTYPLEGRKNTSLETKDEFNMKFLSALGERSLKATINFTMIDDDSVFTPEPVDSSLKDKIDSVLAIQDFFQAREALDKLSPYDIAIRSGVAFAWSMKNMSEEFKLEHLALEDMLLQWKLTGKFKASQKKYEILVTIGSAMQEMSSYKKFYAALNDGLATSDIVYFGGHSGVGKNLSENRIHEQVVSMYDSLPAATIPQHQVVMLMTCYSLRYFPLSSFPMPKKDFVRDVLYTASVPSGYDARMATGLMEQADRSLAKKRPLAFEKWPTSYNADVYLVHQRMQSAK